MNVENFSNAFVRTREDGSIQTRMDALINIAFKREVIRKVTDVIVPLNDIGFGPPFYCVHPIGGAATEFRHMVRMLGTKQRFYGIQAPTDRRNAEFASSIKEMSKYYVNELVKFQPEGAFLLGGYSVGATIALEMSHQLIARGREVSLLVVFDGDLLNTGGEISSLHPLYWLKLLLNVPRWMVDKLVKNRRTLANKAVARLKSVAFKKKNLRATHAVEPFTNRKGFLPDHAAFIRALYDSWRDYVPDSYSGRVLVFVAKTQGLLQLRQVKAAWTKTAPSSEVFEIDGTHLDIMNVPQGRPVAERLRKKIEEIGEQSG
jgi:thioesterase domain-containing protein